MAKRFEKARAYTEKYKNLLLPCRFCHNPDIRIVSDRGMFPPRDEWSVVCTTPKCHCTCGYTSVRAAIAAWNGSASKTDTVG